jgi:hypothetical protein
MPCPPLVPISIIPPVSQGPSPILWQNGNQITRLNTPLNPSWLVYDGTTTRWGDGSAQAPVYLPNIQEVNGPSLTYVAGITSTGQLVKTIGASGTALVGGVAGAVVYQSAPSVTSFTAAGTTGQSLLSGGTGTPTWGTPASATTATNIASGVAGAVPYQSAPSTTAFTAAGTTGQLLSSNGTSTPTWLNQSAIAAGSATSATTATNVAAGVAGAVPYQSGAGATAFTAVGTTGQVLTSNGTSAPSWVSQSSLSVGTATNATTSTTQSVGDNTTAIATTAFVQASYVGSPSQTWTDVTSSRAFVTTYTNSTGRPILVCIVASSTGLLGNKIVNGNISGTAVISNGFHSTTGNNFPSITFIVPSGSTYSADTTGSGATITLAKWFELR